MKEGLQRILATVGSTVRTENNYYVDGLRKYLSHASLSLHLVDPHWFWFFDG
jgi:hypothetical protein